MLVGNHVRSLMIDAKLIGGTIIGTNISGEEIAEYKREGGTEEKKYIYCTSRWVVWMSN